MKHYSNISTDKITWLNVKGAGGVIHNLYYPESIEELTEVVRQCQQEHSDYYVFGHTSNSYLLPSFSPEVVISIIHLKGYKEKEKTIIVECGFHSRVLSRMMVDKGYQGFEGLVDLPGTVSGAIYGNAGCYGCLMSDRLISAEVLTESGNITTYQKEEFGFKERASKLKEGLIKGVVLTLTFEKVIGDADELKCKAKWAHEDRLNTQPGPANNLGSIFKRDCLTPFGIWIRRIGKYTAKLLHIPEESRSILKLKLFLSGYPELERYLFDANRFMWKDANAHEAFKKYLKLRRRLYRHNDFEIEIFK